MKLIIGKGRRKERGTTILIFKQSASGWKKPFHSFTVGGVSPEELKILLIELLEDHIGEKVEKNG